MPPISIAKGVLQNRVANALLVAGKGFIVTAAKTFYALWLQMTGLIFAVFTVVGSSDLVRHYRMDHLQDHRRTAVVALFTVVCGWCTVLSFVKARRTRRG